MRHYKHFQRRSLGLSGKPNNAIGFNVNKESLKRRETQRGFVGKAEVDGVTKWWRIAGNFTDLKETRKLVLLFFFLEEVKDRRWVVKWTPGETNVMDNGGNRHEPAENDRNPQRNTRLRDLIQHLNGTHVNERNRIPQRNTQTTYTDTQEKRVTPLWRNTLKTKIAKWNTELSNTTTNYTNQIH